MKLPFDTVYVLTLPSYKNRYTFMYKQLKKLDIKFKIIFGTDFYNIKNDSKNNTIIYPDIWNDGTITTGKDFSCTILHYNAVYQAYELGFNNILIMEDDICFKKDKNLIEYCFNNIPDDADFVTYDPRFYFDNDFKQFKNDINNTNDLYFRDNGQYQSMFGGMLYAIMNRQTMKLYLENQRTNLAMSDHVRGLFMNVSINKYVSTRCICTDQYNIKTNFDVYKPYRNNYKDKEILNISDFYIPEIFHEFERYVPKNTNN